MMIADKILTQGIKDRSAKKMLKAKAMRKREAWKIFWVYFSNLIDEFQLPHMLTLNPYEENHIHKLIY